MTPTQSRALHERIIAEYRRLMAEPQRKGFHSPGPMEKEKRGR